MNIALINMTCEGSTGKIMFQLAKKAQDGGHKVFTYAPYPFPKQSKNESNRKNHVYFGSYFERKIHNIFGRITGLNGLLSIRGTKQLIKQLKDNDIELIHLHNLHSYCINFPILFKYIKNNNIKIVWTFHDCWTFTGHCPHFDMVGCDKWKTGCYKCCQYREYPQGHIDSSKCMYRLKRKWFSGVENMTIVAPSEWLARLVKQSFLKDYDIKVINNGIDLSVFKPTISTFREKNNIEPDKNIILGVSFGWGKKKGLDVFAELSNRLGNNYQIVLVGTDDNVDASLPQNIISIHKTQNEQELAEIYSTADLFVNPTREEVLGLVNIESLACGTPVLTFDSGGSAETIDQTCGFSVERDDIDAMEKEIKRICSTKPFSKADCVKRAEHFDMNSRFQEYVDLYESV